MPDPDQYPNHDFEAGLLGAMLVGGQDFVDDALLRVRDIDIIAPKHKHIFSAIKDLRLEHDAPIDIMTVGKFARENGRPVKFSDMNYLVDILSVPIHKDKSLFDYYVNVLRSQGNRLQLKAAVFEFQQGKIDNATLIGRLTDIETSDHKDRPLFRSIRDEIAQFRADMESEAGGTVFEFGIPAIDGLVKVYPGNMIVLAGDTSMGKSTLAMQIIQNVAKQKPVLFASIEMVARELIMRMVKIRTGVSNEVVIDPKLTHPEKRKVVYGAYEDLEALPIEIMDVTRCDVRSIHRAAEGVIRKRGDLGLIVIDYIQRMPWPKRCRSEFEAASSNSTGVKDISMDTGVPTLLVSQVSRTGQHEHRAPQLHDLRNSGRIGEDADTVMMIGLPKYSKDQDAREEMNRMLWIRKQRAGPTGFLRMRFNPTFVRYDDIIVPERAENAGY